MTAAFSTGRGSVNVTDVPADGGLSTAEQNLRSLRDAAQQCLDAAAVAMPWDADWFLDRAAEILEDALPSYHWLVIGDGYDPFNAREFRARAKRIREQRARHRRGY